MKQLTGLGRIRVTREKRGERRYLCSCVMSKRRRLLRQPFSIHFTSRIIVSYFPSLSRVCPPINQIILKHIVSDCAELPFVQAGYPVVCRSIRDPRLLTWTHTVDVWATRPPRLHKGSRSIA